MKNSINRVKRPGEIQRRAPKEKKNFQAKGPVFDDTLESSKEAAPKKQPQIRQAGISQVSRTEHRTGKLSCALFFFPGNRILWKEKRSAEDAADGADAQIVKIYKKMKNNFQ